MVTNKILIGTAVAICMGMVSSVFAQQNQPNVAGQNQEDEDYDRLDGMGRSGKKVQVIEWEGNLEIHVYPAGSLKSLGLKLDKKNKAKPVMVIGYRFNNSGDELVRRAILGIDLVEGFKAYRDPKAAADGYDKIIISNNGLADVLAYHFDEPKQLYPDGHPALLAQKEAAAAEKRQPASKNPQQDYHPEAATVDEDGTIQPFYMRMDRITNRP